MTEQRLGCEEQLLPGRRGAIDAPRWRLLEEQQRRRRCRERNMHSNVFIFNIHGYKEFSLDAKCKYFKKFLSFTSLKNIK